MRAIVELWRGGLPLGRAFWLWGVLGGAAVGLSSTLLAVALLAAEAPAWLAALAFAAHLPWNLVLLVGGGGRRRHGGDLPRPLRRRAESPAT